MEKLKIPYPIVVEGKYDRIKLLRVCDGLVIKTDGFGVFKNSELASLLRRLSAASPLIVLTDSDGGGRVIRSRISSLIPRDRLIQLYIPKIEGKEKRKSEPSREGFLGVEGMEDALLYDLLLPFSESENTEAARRLSEIAKNPLSKTDLYIDGLTGTQNAAQRRDALAAKVGLPEGMSPNALLEALKVVLTYGEYLELVGREEKNTTTNGGNDHVF